MSNRNSNENRCITLESFTNCVNGYVFSLDKDIANMETEALTACEKCTLLYLTRNIANKCSLLGAVYQLSLVIEQYESKNKQHPADVATFIIDQLSSMIVVLSQAGHCNNTVRLLVGFLHETTEKYMDMLVSYISVCHHYDVHQETLISG
jgi:hypothetical protein